MLRYGPQRAWVLYREDAAVYVQDQLLIPGWDGSLSEEGTVLSVPPHRTISDTGEPISEWETTVQSIETFLDVFAV